MGVQSLNRALKTRVDRKIAFFPIVHGLRRHVCISLICRFLVVKSCLFLQDAEGNEKKVSADGINNANVDVVMVSVLLSFSHWNIADLLDILHRMKNMLTQAGPGKTPWYWQLWSLFFMAFHFGLGGLCGSIRFTRETIKEALITRWFYMMIKA